MTNADVSTAFRSRTREVFESFLQTVVVLDDLAEMSPSVTESTGDAISGPLTIPDYPQSPAPVDTATDRDPRGAHLDAKSVIDGFADIGSVCAVLNASRGDEFHERTVKAARRADIVVLDWKIHDSFGGETLGVVREILQDDRDARRLRLIAIYTGEPNLDDIYQQVRELIVGFYPDDDLDENDGLRMSKGPLNIVVLAKEGTLTGAPPERRNQEVVEAQLADRLADEFALMTGGLVRNTAIAGVATIRANAHKVLGKFDPSLDPAYLGHRLLLHHPPEAEDHLVEALVSEVASVLEEDRPGAGANVHAIEEWLGLREADGLQLTEPFQFPGKQDAVAGWRDLLDQGFEDAASTGLSLAGKSVGKGRLRKRATEPFAEDAQTAKRSNRRFAALLTLKTHYPGKPPRLSIGTVLRTREDDPDERYFLCLQPKCDSVRLRGWSGFPFIRLIPLEDVQVEGKGTSLRLVVETGQDQWENLGIEPKPSELSVLFFEPGSDPPGEVVGTEGQDRQFFFEDADKKQYHWIAQMKDEHALGVAGEVASALVRPGPNDAEWLRRAFGSSP